MAIDWPALRAAARRRRAAGYAPYSRLHVERPARPPTGRVVVGCNVENASFGLTLCAECGLVSALHATGGGRLVAVSVVAGDGAPLVPCGRCRQLLLEAGGPGLAGGRGPEAGPGGWPSCCPTRSPATDLSRAAGPAGGPACLTPPG